MSTFHGTGAGHILVVQQLEILPDVLCRVTRDQILDHEGHVDLIEGEPVFDQTFVFPEDGLGVAVKQLDQPAVLPAAKRFFQIQRHIVMLDGDQRLDAVLLQFQKYVPVKIQTSLIGRFLHAVGVNARPGDGHAEHLEAHLGKQGNVLFVVVVEIDSLMIRIVVTRQHGPVGSLRQGLEAHHLAGVAVLIDVGRIAGFRQGTGGLHVRSGKALAALVPAAFTLVGSGSTAPEEILRERHGDAPSFLIFRS